MIDMKEKIEFDFESRSFKNITISQVKFWEEAYPDVDVVDCLLKKMPAWIDANADGKGRKKKWKRFIVNWLSRQQDRYGQFKKEVK
jgi:hypothetical protein